MPLKKFNTFLNKLLNHITEKIRCIFYANRAPAVYTLYTEGKLCQTLRFSRKNVQLNYRLNVFSTAVRLLLLFFFS